MAVTISDIARMAGVSNAAVSRYLNGGPVGEEKRQRIREAIETTGYQPSARARSLRSGKSSLVGVVVPKINSETISRVTAGIGAVLREHGYQMILADTENDASVELDYLSIFDSYPVEGIILAGTIITLQHRGFFSVSNVPVVVVGQHVDGVSCVYHDDVGAARTLASLLADRYAEGQFAYISARRDDRAVGADRLQGFMAGLANKGITLSANAIVQADFSIESGAEAARGLISANDSLAVIGCATDTIAAGAIQAVREYYDSNPGENGAPVVSGFGDNHLVKAAMGGIPTVHFAYRTSGALGAETLIDLIERDNTVPVQTLLGYRMVGIG